MTKRKMKDSGVAWIGPVPEGWKILNLLYVLRRRISDGPHETPVCIDEGIPFISVDSLNDTEDIDFSVVKKFISQKDFELFSQRSRIEVGDILFSKAATIGKTAIVKNLGFMVWSPLAIIKPDCEKSDTKYLYYGLNCDGLVNAARLAGSMNTQANVGMRELEKVKVPLPPLAEQRKIAAFLDGECGKIDMLRGKVEKQIAALEEYRKSVITEAVTKGIKRGRKMKPSGVEWIGEVPEGWKILNLLYVLRRRISDGPHETPVCIDEGIPFISVDSLNDTEDIDFSVVKKFISQKDFELFSQRSRIEVGDILFSKAATIGKTAIVKNLGFMVWSPLAIIKPDCEKSDTKYLYYGLNCEGLVNAARLAGSMNTQANVGMRELEKVKVPLPSLSEQREIAAYLDKKCAAIDSMVAKCREELDRLAEYKKSLIYEYVTGKKEVA